MFPASSRTTSEANQKRRQSSKTQRGLHAKIAFSPKKERVPLPKENKSEGAETVPSPPHSAPKTPPCTHLRELLPSEGGVLPTPLAQGEKASLNDTPQPGLGFPYGAQARVWMFILAPWWGILLRKSQVSWPELALDEGGIGSVRACPLLGETLF